uniref:DUF1716 domain-containing protein n=1 Tax=Steinernema glaseri TaxID=37863 RepID=A0A1I7YJZ1_9BILA
MENLFGSLCAALLYAPNRMKFLEGEGIQLMNLMLRFAHAVPHLHEDSEQVKAQERARGERLLDHRFAP